MPQDKILHFLAAYFVADVVERFTHDLPMALLVGLVALAAKEWVDRVRGGLFDWYDLLAGVVGLSVWVAVNIKN